MSNIQEGCIAHFEKGSLWMHRCTGSYKFDQGDNRIWKCQSARGTERLIHGIGDVWVLWDNQDWKKMTYNAETGDFSVQHGEEWYPFWSVGIKKEDDRTTLSNSEIQDFNCSSIEKDVMMEDNCSLEKDPRKRVINTVISSKKLKHEHLESWRRANQQLDVSEVNYLHVIKFLFEQVSTQCT